MPIYQSLNKNIRVSVFPNPNIKKYNLRKIYHTEESVKKNNEKSNEPREASLLEKINRSINLKKSKQINGVRMHTEKLRTKQSETKK